MENLQITLAESYDPATATVQEMVAEGFEGQEFASQFNQNAIEAIGVTALGAVLVASAVYSKIKLREQS